MKKILLSPIVLFLSLFMLLVPVAKAESDPVIMVNQVADEMIAALKEHKATLHTNPSLVYSLAYRIVVPHADLNFMSQRVLPPQIWKQATENERSEFEKEFTNVLVRTYASALADYTDQTIKFYPVRGMAAGRTVKVESDIIRSDGPSIHVSYQLVATESGWKLYDMTVEGISMLESFRSQFSEQLSQGNMANLISVLKQHNAAHSGA